MRVLPVLLCVLLLTAGCTGHLPGTSSDDVDPECAPQSSGGEPDARYPERAVPENGTEAAQLVGDFESAYVSNSLNAEGVESVSVRVDRAEVLGETDGGYTVLVETVANYRDDDAHVEAPYSAVYRVDDSATVRAETEAALTNGSGTPYRVCD